MKADPFEGTAYRAMYRIGEGAMGEVFKVEHLELGSEFVAKVLHKHLTVHPQLVDRARIEAQSLGRLRHPSIVSITGFARTQDGRPFIVMESLRGRTLADELDDRGPLPAFEAVYFARQLLGALGAAHGIGVVHRDIKPNNLFLHTEANGARLLKVLDFGIARVLPGASRAAPLPLEIPTETGAVLGAPRFSSPEAAVGQRVDERADIYGTGLVLYAMLAGRDPFRHIQNEQMLLSAHAVEDPEPPSKHAPGAIPAALDAVVLRALQKVPEQRYQTAQDFEKELRGLAGQLQRPAGWVETTSFDIPADQLVAPASAPASRPAAGRPSSVAKPSEPASAGVVNSLEPVPTLTLADAAADGRTAKTAVRSRAWVGWLVFLFAVLVAAAVGAGGVSALRVLMGEP